MVTMEKDGKIRVLVAKDCSVCTELKGEIGGDKRFEFMDVSSNIEAKRLVRELHIHEVPTFLYTDEKQGKICVLNDDGKADKCIKSKKIHVKK